MPISLEAVRGRGLLIVDSLTTEWGVLESEHGKAVGARVAQDGSEVSSVSPISSLNAYVAWSAE